MVKDIMGGIPPAVAPQTSVSDCVLAMSRSTSSILALTADGTSNGGLLHLLSADDLQPAFGDNPLAILHEIAHASDIEVLRILHLRARAFLLGQLTEPSAVDWLNALGDRINISIVKRLSDLTGVGDDSVPRQPHIFPAAGCPRCGQKQLQGGVDGDG